MPPRPRRAPHSSTPRPARHRRRERGHRARGSSPRVQLERGQAVEAERVLLSLIVEQGVGTARAELLLRPGVVMWTLALVGHKGDAVAARVGDAVHMDDDNGATRLRRPELVEIALLEQLVEARVVGRHHLAAAVQAKDLRRPLECAEHHDDAAVLAQVRDRLRAAAYDVEVRDGPFVEHAQRAAGALRRDVHVPVARERRAAHEEERLARDPVAPVIVYDFVLAAHVSRLAAANSPTRRATSSGWSSETNV